MMRKRPNCTAKRMKPAAREITNVVIVVPSRPCAEPAAPLAVPLRILMMSDILMARVVLSHGACVVQVNDTGEVYPRWQVDVVARAMFRFH